MYRAARPIIKTKRWKSKLVTEAVYNQRLKQVQSGKRRRMGFEDEEASKRPCIQGRRLVDLDMMKCKMYCTFCNSTLNLEKIEGETRRGLVSILKIRCPECLDVNDVPTDTSHASSISNRQVFDINSRAALGSIHTGVGHQQTKNFLSVLDVPAPAAGTFKKHEREVGKVVEAVAHESCYEAAKLERELTIKDRDELSKLLPEDIREGFILPEHPEIVEATDKVRIFASYDMGYSGRGNGFTFDSLNGYSSAQGLKSKKIISYATQNRACRLCAFGHPEEDHDCRLNFYGSAKAMEAQAAVRIVTENKILNDLNLEIGAFIGDNDSSSISAVKKAASYPVIKFSDSNHSAKGVKKMLWALSKSDDPDHELTSDAINYLVRSFNYAVRQHLGNIPALASAIKNVPYHAFNYHENCGQWCGYLKNPLTYDHKTIPGGFTSPALFDKLVEAFDKLAKNAQQFSAGGSTQGKESLNGMIARKAPKAVSLSLSEAADTRVVAAVVQMNEGTSYLAHTVEALRMNSGHNLLTEIERQDKLKKKRIKKTETPEWKKNRRILTQRRSQLRYRREGVEENTYSSNMGLLPEKEPLTEVPEQFRNFTYSCDYSAIDSTIIFFDLETSGFAMSADVLQIAMKSGEAVFNQYLKPRQSIPPAVTLVNSLSVRDGQLYHSGVPVISFPRDKVLQDLLKYLHDRVQQTGEKCILVAHNCTFDAPRLLRIIKQSLLMKEFQHVVTGFCDTLPLFRIKFPNRNKTGELTLSKLATETLNLDVNNAHDALIDICLLKRLALHHFSLEEIENSKKRFDAADIMSSLEPLAPLISKLIRQRLANAGVGLKKLREVYEKDGEEKVAEILKQCKDGKPTVIKTKKHLCDIINYLKEQSAG